MKHPSAVIAGILASVGLTNCDVDRITQEVHSLPTDKYDITLLSPTHITDPERRCSFQQTLGGDAAKITQHARQWLIDYGYSV
ncbi:hypothetical protein Thiowin_00160 [Thiorhodovibrio winogradskyi]|uniref:Uncharacterized protein n=1 Tax=Thiorhodovibrio winogradskyi TaxID=77007 RepID=A0ABZ0S1P1_9GAMM|nr:hypothetical protein [Thiorhodovibrio winogradskyi]